ncbi:MAG: hypothetical protein KJ058_07875 [Thermoanaerobaculia bacterium]|nr:hypothetical protein [Thermoanaerobaculia bacterium]
MSTPAEHLRALKTLPEVATSILNATWRGRRHPGCSKVSVPVELIRKLEAVMRHYPMDHLVDAYWGEDRAHELQAEIRALVERCNEQYLEQAAEIAALWEKYHELLFAVERKIPGESRHETALRYIAEAESAEARGARVAPVREVLARYGINAPSTEEEIIRECPPTLEEER